jgi:hypothetical protein
MIWRSSVVTSSLGRIGGGGRSSGTVFQIPDRTKFYCLVTERAKNVAAGETMQIDLPETTKEIYEYTAPTGAKHSVRVIKENRKAAVKTLTQDEFVARLRAGETWLLPKAEMVDCNDCFGDGKLSGLQNDAKCRSCDGTGSVTVDFLVKW